MCADGLKNSPASPAVFTLQLDDVSTLDGDAVRSVLKTVNQSHVSARRLAPGGKSSENRSYIYLEEIRSDRELFKAKAEKCFVRKTIRNKISNRCKSHKME